MMIQDEHEGTKIGLENGGAEGTEDSSFAAYASGTSGTTCKTRASLAGPPNLLHTDLLWKTQGRFCFCLILR